MLGAWVVLVLFAAAWAQSPTGGRVVMQPQLAQRNTGDSVAVMCQAALKIRDCMFKVRVETEVKTTEVAPLDFSLGTSSPPRPVGMDLVHASYQGVGLDGGQCGMMLTNLTAGRYFVGCRVRSGDLGWYEDYMALVVHTNRISRAVDSNKTQDFFPLVVLPKTSAHHQPPPTIVFTANESSTLAECKFFLPHQRNHVILTTPTNLIAATATHNLSLEGKECRATLLVAEDGSNGVLWCLYRDSKKGDFKLFAPRIIVVMESPSTSMHTTTANVTVGDKFNANCSVATAGPPARIKWTLDGRTIRDDHRDDVTHLWTWPWEFHSITQGLEVTLSREDLGKHLTCHVSQPGGQDKELMAIIRWDPSVCIDSFVVCHWMLVLLVSAAVIGFVAVIAVILFLRSRRDWRWT